MEIVLMENNIPCAVILYYVSTIFNLLPNYEAGKKQSCYDQKLVNHFLRHVDIQRFLLSSTFSLSYTIYIYVGCFADTDLEDWGPSHVLGAGGAAPDPVPAHSVTPRCNVDSELSSEQSPSRWVLRSCAD